MKTPAPTINHEALHAALDRCRQRRELTWRRVTYQVGVPPSTFTRLAAGGLPSATALVHMLVWLHETDLAPYIRVAP